MGRTSRFFALLALLSLISLPVLAQGVSGVFQTDFNEMRLQQSGNAVTGTYEFSGGRIEGTLSGNTLTGRWYQSNAQGRFVFVFSADFSSFEGKWSYGDAEPSGVWNGKRTGGAAIIPKPLDGAVFDSDFSVMRLAQSGPTVTGTYEYSGGKIEGTLSGNTLTGRWYQSNGDGRFVFVFNADFSAFTGKWSYGNAEPSSQWNGTRKPGTGASAGQASASQGQQTGSSSSGAQASATLPAAEGVEVFNNWNKAAVSNGPTGPTYFYLQRSSTVTRVTTYHWNGAKGSSPGTIALKGQDGKTYGPWAATGTSGTGGARNVNWIVSPNVSLPAGTYQIVVSDPASWSRNEGSFGCGFASVMAK